MREDTKKEVVERWKRKAENQLEKSKRAKEGAVKKSPDLEKARKHADKAYENAKKAQRVKKIDHKAFKNQQFIQSCLM